MNHSSFSRSCGRLRRKSLSFARMSFLCVFAVLGVFAPNSDLSNATKWKGRVQRKDREDAKK